MPYIKYNDNVKPKEKEAEGPRGDTGRTSSDKVKITFLGSKKVEFLYNKHNKLRRTMEIFGMRVDKPVASFRFCFEGRRVRVEDTPRASTSGRGTSLRCTRSSWGVLVWSTGRVPGGSSRFEFSPFLSVIKCQVVHYHVVM